jgi:peroxisomal membrane protein 2
MSLSKPEDDNIVKRAIRQYLRLLREKPVLTKSLTSACTGAVSSLLSQYVSMSKTNTRTVNWKNVMAFALTGFLFVGPVMHNFYRLLEQVAPKTSPHSVLKKMIIDRILYTPVFLLTYLYLLSIFEGHSLKVAKSKVDQVYPHAIRMNWKVLTVIQYININYIPQQYRVLFGNAISLAWNCYIAIKRS